MPQTQGQPRPDEFTAGRPVVFRDATVITVDAAGVLRDADVLVEGDAISAIGPSLAVPDGTLEIDASGGILIPGMIDTHRHMWQTALRGYGGDWALSQYFVFYYLQHGEVFRPEDIYAGNLLSALESVDTGVTTTLDWSHALRTPDYADAALQAFDEIPGRFVLGYGNYLGAPWEWT
ncbi:MAG: amidohydrolase family protein, partial [Microbacteriaceae bacterium]